AAYFLDDRLESAVAHAIFADGAGALALSTEGPGPRVVAHRTLFRPEHLDAMGFEYPGGRPRVILSKDVRRIGATMLGEMVRVLMDAQGLKREDVRYWVLHSAGRRVLDRARTLLEIGRGLRGRRASPALVVLDVGGGHGHFARRLQAWARRRGLQARVIVVDREASSVGGGTLVVRADATALPLRDGAADVVTTALTLHHLEPDAAVRCLAEMRAVARNAVI